VNSRPLLIRGGRVVTPGGVLENAAVRVLRGRIEAVADVRLLDIRGAVDEIAAPVVMPGFIDLHVHGFGGHAFARGADATREASRLVASTGVTTWFAGLGAGPALAAIAGTVEAAASVVGSATGGARLGGLFLEGPYISVAKRGAWDPAGLRTPSVPELRRLIAAGAGKLRRINVAPELPGALDFITSAREEGVAVSIGHSNGTYDEALAAVAAGASIANHTFNAMSGLDHRSPGLVGAALTSDDLLAELILDGVHVHPAAALALFRARGTRGLALITDGSQMTGLPEGTYERGGRTLVVAGGAVRLPSGTLAGSVSTFDQDLRNASRWLTDDLVALAAISSGNAARAIGLERDVAAITAGLRADLVLLDDGLNVLATVVGGEVVFRLD